MMFVKMNSGHIIPFILVSLIVTACGRIPSDVRKVLNEAGDNKNELLKVIEHYKQTKEEQKLQATYFLIINMRDRYSAASKGIDDYYNLIKEVNRLKNNETNRDSLDKIMKVKIDSLDRTNGMLNSTEIKYIPDLTSINSDYLIKNIDLAFKVWNMPWARHVGFEDFCEWILPYRINNEPLSNWREDFYNKLISFQDSVEDKSDPKELILKISYYLYNKWTHYDNFQGHGFYTDLINMADCGGGTCDQRYYLITAMYRSLGLPVTIEFTPQWTSYTGGHAWNTFIDNDSTIRPFNGGEDNMRFYEKNVIPMGNGDSYCTKVYRRTFARQTNPLETNTRSDDIPLNLKDAHLLDVTDNYDMPKTRFVLDLHGKGLNSTIVFLACYNYGYDLNYIAWANVKNNKADFGFIGLPALYMALTIENGESKMIHEPFVGTMDEQYRHFYHPDMTKKGTVRLYRKFNFSGEFLNFAQGMIGSKFQGANKADFSDAENLDTIKVRAKAYEELIIKNPGKFRFLRYQSNDSTDVRVAELEFWGKKNDDNPESLLIGKVIGRAAGQIDYENDAIFTNAFDSSIRTNFNAKAGSWVGIDLGKNNASAVSRIWYLPRNNYNEIENGHVYELLYFADTWVSLGKQKADKHYLIYNNVPLEAYLLLKDLTGGRQERIFTYNTENNEQVWW